MSLGPVIDNVVFMKKLVILLLLAMPIGLMAGSGVPELERGASMFQYPCEGYFEGVNLDVYYYIPQQGTPFGKRSKRFIQVPPVGLPSTPTPSS